MMGPATATRVAAITDDLILSTAGNELRIIDANGAWTKALGWKEEEIVGFPLSKFVAPEDRSIVHGTIQSAGGNGDVKELSVAMVGAEGIVRVIWRFCRHETDVYGVGRLVENEAVESRVQQVLDKHEQRRSELEEAALSATVAEKKAGTWRTWLAAGAIAASVGGAALAWTVDKLEDNFERAHEVKERKNEVDGALTDLKGRADVTDEKFKRVGSVLIETQVQVADSVSYLVDKLDASSSTKARQIPEPPTVQRAREKVEAIKEKRNIDKLFAFDKDAPDDPFVDIEDDLAPATEKTKASVP